MLNRLKNSFVFCLVILLIVSTLPNGFTVSANGENIRLKSNLSIKEGKKRTLTIDTTSDIKVKKVTWRTSNKKIVSIVSNTKLKCKIYAEKEGNANLYAVCTCIDGKITFLKKLTCKITVKEKQNDDENDSLLDNTDEPVSGTEFEGETDTQQTTDVVENLTGESTTEPVPTVCAPVNTIEPPARTTEPVATAIPNATVMPTLEPDEDVHDQVTEVPVVTQTAEPTIQPIVTMAVQITTEPEIIPTTGAAVTPIIEPTAIPVIEVTAAPTAEPEIVEPEEICAELLIDEEEHMVVGVENGETATYAIIPDGIQKIDNFVFSGCSKLKQVTLPSSLQEIGNYAFSGCTSLENVTIPEGVRKIMEGVFCGCSSMTRFYVPKKVEYIGPFAVGDCQQMRELVVDPENPYFDCRDNCNAIIATEMSVLISACNYSTIPEDVVGIDFGAFGYCENMTKIQIPNSVRSISSLGFVNCMDLDTIEWNETVYSDVDTILLDFEELYPDTSISYYESYGVFDDVE